MAAFGTTPSGLVGASRRILGLSVAGLALLVASAAGAYLLPEEAEFWSYLFGFGNGIAIALLVLRAGRRPAG